LTYWVGQELDWDAPKIPVKLCVELPFWIMVPNCLQKVEVNDYSFDVWIIDDFIERYLNVITDSGLTCAYFGPPSGQKNDPKLMTRHCKTVLVVRSECNKDVLAAKKERNARERSANRFLIDFCMAHLPIINKLIQHYRLATYDYFAYEVSPWDVPIWYVASDTGSGAVRPLDYVKWDEKPVVISGSSTKRYELVDENQLQAAIAMQPSAGEFELLDALNFMERGDYSGAVRRITTAIEAQTEFVLRQELQKIYSAPEVEDRLNRSRNNFPRRLRHYENLSRRNLSGSLRTELNTTRDLRHKIVHNGLRITFAQRGEAQKAVDTGRWIFNWLENKPDRSAIREQLIAKRSLGRNFSVFDAEITSAGVIVHKPQI
jgi:hypothetical protein